LRHLKAAGKKVGIITATTRFSFEHDLDQHHIPRDLLDYTQTADDTAYHKPDKRVFDPVLSWLENVAIRPGEVIYIGDGLHDMKAALESGFSFLGVETGLVTAEQFKSAGASSIPSIASLPGLVR
jgi:phosphoglycolate phosphatase-like HAD superfamily hydrolase